MTESNDTNNVNNTTQNNDNILYVSHTCKNPECQSAFSDLDKTHVKSFSPNWKYCPDCVAKGYPNFKNPNLTPKQKAALQKFLNANPSKLENKK